MIETELRDVGTQVEFVVRTDVARYQERLPKMGWWPSSAPGTFTRRLDRSADVAEIFGRFTSRVELMIQQSLREVAIDWQAGLVEWVGRVQDSGLRWWLYGSGALAVRGVDVTPGDLDLHVSDASLAGRLLADLLVEPVTELTGWVADRGGRAWHGVLIEWLSDAHPSGADPPHEQEPAAGDHLEHVVWRGLTIPVPALALQLAVAERRGLPDRAELIRRAMQR
ncbi:MAG TPA: hypothetical protein VG899_06545 [Mycobacteriales bacterium]|nr:hypothetical protein [Mycobacteriales bacterium]